MSYRVQWRERTPKGVPSKIKWEDGYDTDGAAFKVGQLLAKEPAPCWINVEDLESKHKGSSSELERKRATASAAKR